jgi:hypothetical protein
VSKHGITAFAAEAALWVTGAALIAGAAGMHWSVNLPTIDLLTPKTPDPALVATASPIASGPVVTVPPANQTVVQKLKAFLDNPGLQLEFTMHVSMEIAASGRTVDAVETDTVDYNAGAASRVAEGGLVGGTHTSSSQVTIGDTVYYRTGSLPWATMRRSTDYLLPITLHWENRVFVDKGVEKMSGRQLHRIEATDAAELSADYQKASGFSNVKMALVYWADNNGLPVIFDLSGSYTTVVNGVTENVKMNEASTVVKTKDVVIESPT